MQRHLRCLLVTAFLVALSGPALAQAPAPSAPTQKPCAAAGFGQFDFWVGHWDVYGPNGKQVANSLIEKVYGCGVRENWMPFNGAAGGSLNIYVPEKKRWEQFWIDGSGTRAHFIGGLKDRQMILEGEWAGPLTRMTYTPNADGSVRQFGEQSTDGGTTWAPAFDFIYRPHQGK